MPMPIYPALADAKVVFARGLQLPSNPDHVIFNAPRPLLGTQPVSYTHLTLPTILLV